MSEKLTAGDAGMLTAAREGRLRVERGDRGDVITLSGLPADHKGRTSRAVTHKALRLVERGLLTHGLDRFVNITPAGDAALDAWQVELHERITRPKRAPYKKRAAA